MNVVDYLVGEDALTRIRSKEVIARRLDREKAREQGGSLRFLNLALPNVLIVLFGLGMYYVRKRRNEKRKIAE